jgi:hypothetical protein
MMFMAVAVVSKIESRQCRLAPPNQAAPSLFVKHHGRDKARENLSLTGVALRQTNNYPSATQSEAEPI